MLQPERYNRASNPNKDNELKASKHPHSFYAWFAVQHLLDPSSFPKQTTMFEVDEFLRMLCREGWQAILRYCSQDPVLCVPAAAGCDRHRTTGCDRARIRQSAANNVGNRKLEVI